MDNTDIMLGCLGYILLFLGIFTIPPTIWVVSSYFEAQSYNSITDSNVSTWDAMFVELRIQGEAKE
jgi:hypothetical protein